jgi:WD40 repeat protein
LISGAKNGDIKTWNSIPQIRAPDRLQRPPDVSDWSLRNDTVMGVHTNGAITFWNASTLRPTARFDKPASMSNAVASAFLSSGKLVWANDTSEVVVWDLVTRQRLTRLQWVPGREKGITVSSDEKLLVGFADGQGLTVWDLERLQEVETLPRSAVRPLSVDISRDLHWVAAGTRNGTVELWNLSRKQRVGFWQAHNQLVSDLAFLPDGKQLVTVSYDATSKLWDVETGRQLRSFPRTLNAFGAIAISADGHRIAAASNQAPIVLWDASTGQQMVALAAPYNGGAQQQFVGAHGDTLISFGAEEVRLWRAPSLEKIAAAEAKDKR